MNFKVKAFLTSFLIGVIGSLPTILVVTNFTIPNFNKEVKKLKSEEIQIAVQSVTKTLDFYHAKVLNNELTEDEAKSQALAIIKTLRYKGSEYFWINDTHPKMVMHPFRPELDGKDLSDFKDPNGKKLFVEMTKVVASADKSGFVDYEWARPKSDKPVPKISYVSLFEPWGWIIGSGIYVDDINELIAANKNNSLFYLGLSILFLISVSLYSAINQINKWIVPIQNVMQQLESESHSLSASATQIKTSSTDLEGAGQEQQGAVTQISASIEEINSMMLTGTKTAESSNEIASQTANLSKEGMAAIYKVKDSLSAISSTNQNTVESIKNMANEIKAMSSAMEEISTKASMINEIVFQTKLLSFNASVEAARAGEHGKGFSIVAEEIASLAKRSGESAQEIAGILDKNKKFIETIISESDKKFKKISEENQSAIKDGESSVDECETLLQDVSKYAIESNQKSQNLLESYEKQTLSTNEILTGIQLIDKKVSTSMLNAGQTKQLADQIAENAIHLKDIVDRLQTAVQSKKKAA